MRSLLLPSSWNTFQTSPRLQQMHWYWPKRIKRRMPTSHDGMSNTMWVIKYYYQLTTLILLHIAADHHWTIQNHQEDLHRGLQAGTTRIPQDPPCVSCFTTPSLPRPNKP